MYIYNIHIVIVKRIGFVPVDYITILSIEAYWFLVVNYKNTMFVPPTIYPPIPCFPSQLRLLLYHHTVEGRRSWVEIGVPVSIISISSESSISTIWESCVL